MGPTSSGRKPPINMGRSLIDHWLQRLVLRRHPSPAMNTSANAVDASSRTSSRTATTAAYAQSESFGRNGNDAERERSAMSQIQICPKCGEVGAPGNVPCDGRPKGSFAAPAGSGKWSAAQHEVIYELQGENLQLRLDLARQRRDILRWVHRWQELKRKSPNSVIEPNSNQKD